MDNRTGKVYLVGAGCGKADLITVRGLEKIRTCDVLIYDDLIDTQLLSACPAGAERIYMGSTTAKAIAMAAVPTAPQLAPRAAMIAKAMAKQAISAGSAKARRLPRRRNASTAPHPRHIAERQAAARRLACFSMLIQLASNR